MKFSCPGPPAKLFFLLFFRSKVPITNFVFFSHPNLHIKQWRFRLFWFRPKAIFLILRNLPPFCSTICINLLSVELEPWRRFKNSYSSQAKWFGCIFLDHGKYTVENAREMCCSTLQKVADPKKNISIHKIPFFGEECRIKKKRRKAWINVVLERRKMWVPGKTFYFKIPVQQRRCLNLDA